MTAVFWDHKDVLLVYFLAHSATVTAEDWCDTLEWLWQVRLLHQVFIIFHDNARPHTTDDI
jgi:hypothetical protein